MDAASTERERAIWRTLESVEDPEIPVVSIVDLGIVRYVRCAAGEPPHIGITPTYSGCPATEAIHTSILESLRRAGHDDVVIEPVLSPPWTSDWLSAEGRRKLAAFGIAPPPEAVLSPRRLLGVRPACPRCGSEATEILSEFGSTPCKSHHRCTACLEPFDSFKCI